MRDRVRQLKRRSFLVGAVGLVAGTGAFFVGAAVERRKTTNAESGDRLQWAERLARGPEDDLIRDGDYFVQTIRVMSPSATLWQGVRRLIGLIEARDVRIPARMSAQLLALLREAQPQHGDVSRWISVLERAGRGK